MLCFSRVYSRVISLTLTRAFASFDQFNLITNSDFALLQHGKIEARTLTRQEPLDDVRAAKLDPELCNRASAARSPSRRPSQRETCPRCLAPIQKVPWL